MQFEEELRRVLAPDLPYRERVIAMSARHLEMIAEANEHMNLTRLTSPREAAIKHVYDSLAPWRHFQHAGKVLDAGTGAGFPGIPLALVLPEVRFTLVESIQKKARFVDSAVEALELANVQVMPQRAEEVTASHRFDIITARAVAPMARLLELFRKPLKQGACLLLYKGADVEAEIAEAVKHQLSATIVCRYELPEGLGSRTLVEVAAKSAGDWSRRQAQASQG